MSLSATSRHARRTWMRMALSVGVLAALLLLGDAESVLRQLGSLAALDILLVWLVFGAALLLSAWRWQLILRSAGARVPLRSLFAAYLAGLFFNQVLPGSVGGDVGRACHLYGHTGRGREAASSALLDRLCGVMGLGALMLLALPWVGAGSAAGEVAATAGLVLLAGGLAVWWGLGHGLMLRMVGLLPDRGAGHLARSLVEAVLAYRRRPTLLGAVAISVPIHALQAGLYALLAQRLGLPVAAAWFLVLVPVAQVVAMLPLSLGGLGVREATLAALFVPLGVPAADIVAVSLAVHALTAAFGLAGGALVLLSRSSRRPARASVPVSASAARLSNQERGATPAVPESHLGLREPNAAPL